MTSRSLVSGMYRRGSQRTMNLETDDTLTTQPSPRTRHNPKLKVLVRSHAVREETSPPRGTSPLISPSIQVIPSSDSISDHTSSPLGNPVLVLSPSMSRVHSPSLSPVCISPTTTLIPSRCSPPLQHDNSLFKEESCTSDESDVTYLSNKFGREKIESDAKRDTTSHYNNKKKICCDCMKTNCTKCDRIQERNINNNLTNINNNIVMSSNTLSVSRANAKNKLRQQSSSQGSFDGSLSNSPCLSRDSSSEQYTDTSGADLEVFIPDTLNRNAKDRAFMLRLEQELLDLAKDVKRTHFKFPPMSSYQRMLVHRCAAYFGMDHNIESTGKCVVVNKTKNTRIPEKEFRERIKADVIFSEEPRRSILKRDSNSIEDYGFKSPDRQGSMERRSRSFEEREEEYAKARRRIFDKEELSLLRQRHGGGGSQDFEWDDMPWSCTDSSSENAAKFKLQLPDVSHRAVGKFTKVLSEEIGEPLRPYVTKSYSFGGYGGVLNRGDSLTSTQSAGGRLLTKQDSGASSVSWRLSPSSSGYKSQSQMSESITPSPTSTPHQLTHDGSDIYDRNSKLVWAVTDMHHVPKGSIIIDPHTGEPIKNEDGSLYHYDPHHPPPDVVTYSTVAPLPCSPKKSPAFKKDETLLLSSSSPKKHPAHFSGGGGRHVLHVTNSSTSPSLPYSPPLESHPTNGGIQFVAGVENVASLPPPPPSQYPFYSSGFSTGTQEPNSVYQQACVVYTTPYVGSPFENRLEPSNMGDVSGSYYVMDNTLPATPAPPTYQQPPPLPPYYTQQVPFYQVPQAGETQVRYNCMPPPYSQSYVPPHPSPNMVPLFPPPPMQIMYSNQQTAASQPNSMMYSCESNAAAAYLSHNSVYNPGYAASAPHFPPPSVAAVAAQDPMVHLVQNVAQMGLVPSPASMNQSNNPNYLMNKMPSHFDVRRTFSSPKHNKFTGKSFMMASSQSSTGTSSPATTIIPAYCPTQSAHLYRTPPPETPPTQYYGPQVPAVPPRFFRQVGCMRVGTPGATKTSQSPSPASDMANFDRTRMAAPHLLQGTPYLLQAEARTLFNRAPTNVYFNMKQPTIQQQQQQTLDSRNQRPRRPKGGKIPTTTSNAK